MKAASTSITAPSLNATNAAQLLDVRTPAEFEEAHIPGSKLAPLDRFEPEQVCEVFDTEQPIYIICGSGKRAAQAVEKMQASGHDCAVLLEGGIAEWEKHDLRLNRGRKAMSLERQVRIAAGALVVIGVALSFANPWFLVLPAFIGSGLVFAGITDSCGMGMMLAKMPWNRRTGDSVAARNLICAATAPSS